MRNSFPESHLEEMDIKELYNEWIIHIDVDMQTLTTKTNRQTAVKSFCGPNAEDNDEDGVESCVSVFESRRSTRGHFFF